jgi:hypothetical protein
MNPSETVVTQLYEFMFLCFLLMSICVVSMVYMNWRREQALKQVLDAIIMSEEERRLPEEEEEEEEEEAVENEVVQDDEKGGGVSEKQEEKL